jgi:hypothetical protein
MVPDAGKISSASESLSRNFLRLFNTIRRPSGSLLLLENDTALSSEQRLPYGSPYRIESPNKVPGQTLTPEGCLAAAIR